MKRKLSIYGCIFLVFIICGIWYIKVSQNTYQMIPIQKGSFEGELSTEQDRSLEEENIKVSVSPIVQEKQEDLQPEEYMVYVCGAVMNPDVYALFGGSRINDALKLAGGPTEDADLTKLNLADYIQDAQMIYVPKVGEELTVLESRHIQTGQISSGLININTASQKELETLPGIGPVIAQYIIEYREEKGFFQTIEEIQKVSRIGTKTFDKIKDQITVK